MTHEPWYGELKLYHKRWGQDIIQNEDFVGAVFDEIPIRPCTPEELGVGPLGYDDPKAKFYPINEDHKHLHDVYWKKLNCVDQKLIVHGDYQSVDVTHLTIHLERCNPEVRSDCKTDEEITFWLRRKFICTLINNERFDPEIYEGEKVVREGIFTWNPVKSTVVEEVVNKI